MNFSKLPPSGIPLWWLLFKGEKTVTRRPPACLHCGKKWWEHIQILDQIDGGSSTEKRMCKEQPPAAFDASLIIDSKKNVVEKINEISLMSSQIKFYEPDLSRWQPGNDARCINPNLNASKGYCGLQKRHHMAVAGKLYCYRGGIETYQAPQRELAICPARGKAAICKNCGGWKSWHGIKPTNSINTKTNVGLFYDREGGRQTFYFGQMLPQTVGYPRQYIELHEICSHYEPFRLKVKSVMMESEWENQMRQFFTGKPDRNFNVLPWETCLKHEATREGFNGDWNALQEALYGKGGYQKGTPLARIEFERR